MAIQFTYASQGRISPFYILLPNFDTAKGIKKNKIIIVTSLFAIALAGIRTGRTANSLNELGQRCHNVLCFVKIVNSLTRATKP